VREVKEVKEVREVKEARRLGENASKNPLPFNDGMDSLRFVSAS